MGERRVFFLFVQYSRYSRPIKFFGCLIAPLIVNQHVFYRKIKLIDYKQTQNLSTFQSALFKIQFSSQKPKHAQIDLNIKKR